MTDLQNVTGEGTLPRQAVPGSRGLLGWLCHVSLCCGSVPHTSEHLLIFFSLVPEQPTLLSPSGGALSCILPTRPSLFDLYYLQLWHLLPFRCVLLASCMSCPLPAWPLLAFHSSSCAETFFLLELFVIETILSPGIDISSFVKE